MTTEQDYSHIVVEKEIREHKSDTQSLSEEPDIEVDSRYRDRMMT